MQILRRKLLEASRRLPLFYAAPRGRADAVATLAAAARWAPPASAGSLAVAPWAATQRRGAKMLGSDVELRDVDTGNKITERFRTDEALENEMKVNLQYFDGRPMSATVPPRVTCTVVEAQPNTKGLTAQPQYKRVVLDNGLTVLAPPFIEAGEKIVISTADDSYMTRA
ncbi:hypothetical protein C2845_PM01G22910 [Panicum miliaceum]|uniref:Elongation factor P C-terminal domain-containing protein n=1 Tax=Panicum miliaceum TaxID=4540 RepID=A0A3L6TR31_PANMI|nr:hypothetical protein C2845_PM01G22910 [Panicum miliaceum]